MQFPIILYIIIFIYKMHHKLVEYFGKKLKGNECSKNATNAKDLLYHFDNEHEISAMSMYF